MKLRIFPKKNAVLTMIDRELESVEGYINAETAALAEAEGKLTGGAIYNPYLEQEIAALKRNLASLKDRKGQILDRMALIESHEPPEVMMEIELG